MATTMNTPNRIIRRSAGATLLEVLFATVVIVVGLIGIATLIPFAARDARQAINHNQAVSLGASWRDAFFTRELNKYNGSEFKWIWFRDYVADGTSLPDWEEFRLEGYASLPASPPPNLVRLRINGDPNVGQAYQAPTFSGSSVPSQRLWGHMPICIDPLFFTSATTAARISQHKLDNGSPFIDKPSRPEWYRASVFPYFEDSYDPAVDPYDSTGSSLFSDQPRMLRVGLAASAIVGGTPINDSLASSLFSSTDDFIDDSFVDLNDLTDPRASRPDTKVLPPERLFAKPGGKPTRALFSKRYTWMATITPEEPKLSNLTPALADSHAETPAQSAKVTFLIMYQHDTGFVPQNYTAGSTEDKPKGERVVRVYPISGNFVGGAGGRVRLVGNGNTSNLVQVGDWIMLSRHYVQDGSTASRLYPFYRWYRIIGVDADAMSGTLASVRPNVGVDQYASANASNDNQIVWARDVSLEGLDFRFGEFPPSNLNTQLPYKWWPSVPSPTTGTLVSGVITVFHREMSLN